MSGDIERAREAGQNGREGGRLSRPAGASLLFSRLVRWRPQGRTLVLITVAYLALCSAVLILRRMDISPEYLFVLLLPLAILSGRAHGIAQPRSLNEDRQSVSERESDPDDEEIFEREPNPGLDSQRVAEDIDVGQFMQKRFEAEGITVQHCTEATRVSARDGRITLEGNYKPPGAAQGSPVQFTGQALLLAVDRCPMMKALNLEAGSRCRRERQSCRQGAGNDGPRIWSLAASSRQSLRIRRAGCAIRKRAGQDSERCGYKKREPARERSAAGGWIRVVSARATAGRRSHRMRHHLRPSDPRPGK